MEKSSTSNKSFWKFIKPFLTGFIGNNYIKLIHKKKISKTFGINLENTVQSVKDIDNSYRNHPVLQKLNK